MIVNDIFHDEWLTWKQIEMYCKKIQIALLNQQQQQQMKLTWRAIVFAMVNHLWQLMHFFQFSPSVDVQKFRPHLAHCGGLDNFRMILLSSLISLEACDDFKAFQKALDVTTDVFYFLLVFCILFLFIIFGIGLMITGGMSNELILVIGVGCWIRASRLWSVVNFWRAIFEECELLSIISAS